MRERIADPVGWRDKQTKIKKEKDWYFSFKEEEKLQHQAELDYKNSLNPISLFIYDKVYGKCCKSKRKSKYTFEMKKNN